MRILTRHWPWSRRTTIVGLLLLGVIWLIGLHFSASDPSKPQSPAVKLPVVELATATTLASTTAERVIGSVEAVSRADVAAERGGVVRRVNIELGDYVRAGAVLIAFDGSAEQAAVVQAEGAYEAAKAAASQNEVGIDEARNALTATKASTIATLRTAYSTVDGIIKNNIDPYFANPNSMLPGLWLDGHGQAPRLNEIRVAYQTSLPNWREQVNALTPEDDLDSAINKATTELEAVEVLVNDFLSLFNRQSRNSRYSEAEMQQAAVAFNSIRNNLITLQSQIKTSSTNLTAAQKAITRAELAASGGTTSVADAQLKQAYGGLLAAQAAASKTVVRAPISGEVSELFAKVGEYVGASAPIATIVNQGGVEVVSFVSPSTRANLVVGQNVTINDNITGVISVIAPTINPATKKIELRISTSDTSLTAGDTVRLTLHDTPNSSSDVSSVVRVPLTAVKFAETDSFVFTVVANRLVAKPVTLGAISGGSVVIESGLTTDQLFVVDARGLTAETEVIVR